MGAETGSEVSDTVGREGRALPSAWGDRYRSHTLEAAFRQTATKEQHFSSQRRKDRQNIQPGNGTGKAQEA